METYLSLTPRDQATFCEQTAIRLGLPPASIEKDFWVCWTIQRLFSLPDWGEHFSFKGGTSLSKAWKLIHRFSEDIDIVIDRPFLGFEKEEPSQGQLKTLRERCTRRIQQELLPQLAEDFRSHLPKGLSWNLYAAAADEAPDGQTLIFEYPGRLTSSVSYLRPAVKIEMGARSETEPAELPLIRPYLYEAFPDQLGQADFPVRTVVARRTFWDKALLLHEENYRPPDQPRKRVLARHYYDLGMLIDQGIADEAIADEDLFDHVAKHRQRFFPYKWMDYDTMKRGTLQAYPSEATLPAWRADYDAMSTEMFYGEVPTFDQVLKRVADFQDAFNL